MEHDLEARLAAMLVAAGASPDEVATATGVDALLDLSIDVGLRPTGDRLTLIELARSAGLPLERAQLLCRCAGLSGDDVTSRRWFTSDTEWLVSIEMGIEIFGEDATLGLIRRSGSLAAQMAHGAASVFRVATSTVAERQVHPEEAAQRNLAVRELVDQYLRAFTQIFRHHSRAGVRSESVAAGAVGEMRDLCVGFVDIASSSQLGERVDAAELAELVSTFEQFAFGAASAHGARVVKTIGDEVMFCADGALPVARSALALVDFCETHPTFVGARGGIARGPLLDQAGDCYGPVVNRAARFVQAAPDGAVMTDDAVASELLAHTGIAIARRPPSTHRGIGLVPWSQVSAAPAPPPEP